MITVGSTIRFDIQMVDRVRYTRHHHLEMKEADMSDQPEDPDAAADRLEAALERIARVAAVPPARPGVEAADLSNSELSIREIADQLDALIERLRTAVGMEFPASKP
jgi:hypothetical protein